MVKSFFFFFFNCSGPSLSMKKEKRKKEKKIQVKSTWPAMLFLFYFISFFIDPFYVGLISRNLVDHSSYMPLSWDSAFNYWTETKPTLMLIIET